MEIAKIEVSGVHAHVIFAKPIPKGIIGAQVKFDYIDPLWDGLTRNVVFDGAQKVVVLNAGDTVRIPYEAVAAEGAWLQVGVYGVDAENNIVIPTLWATLGKIRPAADLDGDPAADPALPVWAQLLAMIGNLENLDTAAKNSLVAAVNELAEKISGTAIEEQITAALKKYLEANPLKETDPSVPDWAKQPGKPAYTAAEVGALSQEELQTGIDHALTQAKESGLFDGPAGPQGPIGPAYELTEADKTEIAEQAAGLVEVPEGSGFVAQDTPPENTKLLWVDTTDESDDNLYIPTKVSELTNDSGYQTQEQVTAIVNQQLGVIENGTY